MKKISYVHELYNLKILLRSKKKIIINLTWFFLKTKIKKKTSANAPF